MAVRLAELRRRGVAIAIPGDGHITREVHAAVAEEIVTALRGPSAAEIVPQRPKDEQR
jgi:hypothetical protein